MKTLFITLLSTLTILETSFSQGAFVLDSETALTRIGTIAGPLAGPEIWAQAFGGFTVDSVEPVGMSVQHIGGGLALRTFIVPWADVNQTIFVQMAAWDGTVWGTDYAMVPSGHVGHTDAVTVLLTSPTANPNPTQFTHPAVVPIPEPSTFALLVFSGTLLTLCRRSLWVRGRGHGFHSMPLVCL